MEKNAACLPAVHSLAERSRSQRGSDRLAEHPWGQPKWKSRLLVSQIVCCRDCQTGGLSEQLTCGTNKKQDLAVVRIFLILTWKGIQQEALSNIFLNALRFDTLGEGNRIGFFSLNPSRKYSLRMSRQDKIRENGLAYVCIYKVLMMRM